MDNEKTAGSNLTPIAEYSETAMVMADLRSRHEGVVYDVATPKQMKLAKEARAEIRGYRVALEKTRVEIKAPALERCRQIDSEAKRLTAELVALEEPIDVQIKAEEARAEAERLAKLEAERLRVEAIQQKIQQIRDVPAGLVGKPSVIIAGQLAKLRETTLDEAELGADYLAATDALTAAIARVTELLTAQQEADAEKKRQADRDAEMEAMRAKMAEQQRLIDEAEEAKRVEQERLAQVEQERVAREDAEARRRAQAIRDRISSITEKGIAISGRSSQWLVDTLEDLRGIRPRDDAEFFGEFINEAVAAWGDAEDKIEAEIEVALLREKAEADAQAAREAEDARLQAERERQAAEQRKLDEQAAQLKRERAEAAKKAEADRLANLGLREAAQAVVDYEVTDATPIGVLWNLIDDLSVALANDAAAASPLKAVIAARPKGARAVKEAQA